MITTLCNIFLFDVNFDKSIIILYFLSIFFMFAKFLEDQKAIAMNQMVKFQVFVI